MISHSEKPYLFGLNFGRPGATFNRSKFRMEGNATSQAVTGQTTQKA